MKQSEILVPVRFDDKDFLVDDVLWSFFFTDNVEKPIQHCMGNCYYQALFFLPEFKRDRAFSAKILHHACHKIEVKCLQDDGTIWLDDVNQLKTIFMADNMIVDTDIFVDCKPTQEHDGRYIALTFEFYHTSPDLADL